mmetsp:Transcript_9239/g.33889  ORF Transcript_9239/g.33889 Transcript_9239/m.33889 type:complete len:457 (-) Transcript_9239:303-1673(-)
MAAQAALSAFAYAALALRCRGQISLTIPQEALKSMLVEPNHPAAHPPRFCILTDPTATNERFAASLRDAVYDDDKELWDFLIYDRDTGSGVLPGLTEYKSPCPRFALQARAEWACALERANGILQFDTPLKDVQTVSLSQHFAMFPPCANGTCGSLQAKEAEHKLVERGRTLRRFGKCRKGRCDCYVRDRSLQPVPCRINDVVRILNDLDANLYTDKRGNLTLILAGTDGPRLSQIVPYARQWIESGWFKRIFYEGVDVQVPGIDTYPKGFDMHYTLGREERLLTAILSASIAPEAKPYLALGAWGNRGGPTLYSPESYELDSFIRSVQAVEEAQSGDADCEDPRANTFVEHRMLDAREYYFELAKYKFLVAPHGNGIQSPKFLEALMVLTIPVTKRYGCFEQLQQYGYPIVLVDDWSELTRDRLEQEWARMSPRLEKSRWLGTIEGVESLLYGRC